jgi:hypothetical protein
MNHFDAYADEKGYRGLPKKQEKLARGPSELELQQAEKQRLSRAYRAWKRAWAREQYAAEPRLKNFRRYLRSVTDGEELLEAIGTSWLPASPVEVRLFALRLVDARCQRLRLLAGEELLDDPWPPETNVYFEAKAMLYPGGRH